VSWKLKERTLAGEVFLATTFFTGEAFLGEALTLLAFATILIDGNVL
jgi:hypothetical protein